MDLGDGFGSLLSEIRGRIRALLSEIVWWCRCFRLWSTHIDAIKVLTLGELRNGCGRGIDVEFGELI